jgi:hypothetical protein
MSDGSRVELQEVRFHAVAEDYTVRRHTGFDPKLISILKDASKDTCLRVAADEWFTHNKKKSPVFP